MQLILELSNLKLNFRVLDNPIAQAWLERMAHRHQCPMDDANRFYGFDTPAVELARAEHYIQQCINTINAYQPIIDQPFTDCFDQDRLNYYHNIFERYHGQLDQQGHDFWNQAPDTVKQALAELNLAVHRCETATRPQRPRVVCTWYGMPKIKHLDLELQQQHGTMGAEFGAVYLNYCEIGKMIKEMALDRDQYMANEMFRPFDFYSADFVATFFDETPDQISSTEQMIKEYFETNREFFAQHGITSVNDVRVRPLRFKVAQLEYEFADKSSIIQQIRDNQHVRSVTIQ